MQKISAEREAFRYFLRTGRRLPPPDGTVEFKFNPYHDPRDGRFTFAPGGTRSSSKAAAPERHRTSPTARPKVPAAQAVAVPPLPYLSSMHNEIRDLASRYRAAPGTNEWTIDDAVEWKLGGKTFLFSRSNAFTVTVMP